MLPKEVIFLPGIKHRRNSTSPGRSLCPVVEKRFLLEGSRLPSIHSRCCDCNPIHAAGLVWNEATDLFKTPAAEQLTSSGDVSRALKAVATRVIMVFHEERSSNAKIGICLEAVQQKYHIIRCKRHVGIETAEDVVFQSCNAGVTGVESLHLRREIPPGASRTPNELNPRIPLRKTGDNCSRLIYRAVIHDDPSGWEDNLIDNGFQSVFDVRFFIARWCDQQVGKHVLFLFSRPS